MAESTFEHAEDARRALHVIVSDPAYGTNTLANPQQLSNLLTDYLPDAPREVSVLIAAARARVSESLSEHLSQGMNVSTAIRLTASSFAASTAFAPDVCEWVASEMAIALGLDAGAGQAAGSAPPLRSAPVASEAASTHVPAMSPASTAAEELTKDSRPGPAATALAVTSDSPAAQAPRQRRGGQLALIGGCVGAACAIVIAIVVAASSSSSPPPSRELGYYQLAKGDCLRGSNLRLSSLRIWPESVQVVPCSAQHVGEVYFAGNAWPQSQPFPGGAAIGNDAVTRCDRAFVSYVGVPYTSTPYQYADVSPSARTWAAGDRRVLCVAYRPTATHVNGQALDKSIKGTG